MKLMALSPVAVLMSMGKKTAVKESLRPPVGFNIVSWFNRQAADHAKWEAAINDIYNLGVKNITIITYRFIDQCRGTLSPNSLHGLKSPPANNTIAAAIRSATDLGMSVSLNPFIEVDNPTGIGKHWRGGVDFPERELETFFIEYSAYIEEMAYLLEAAGGSRIYIGSELAALSRNPAAQGFWLELIRRTRRAFNGPGRKITYAANHDEYENVPFWEELDEVGIDAYFALATRAEAAGEGNPEVFTIIARWRRQLDRLRRFAGNKPVIISEWGTVPLDLTSYQPWNWRPSAVTDSIEQLNAYRATLEAIQSEANWLAGVNLWHWQMPGNEGSQYGIVADSLIGRLIGRFARGERIDDVSY